MAQGAVRQCLRLAGPVVFIMSALFAAAAPVWSQESVPAAQDAATLSAPPPLIVSRYFLASDGVRLHVLEGGPAGAAAIADSATPAGSAVHAMPVIAFVPGWSMPARIWQAQLGALSTRYRVAALDPRGQGESELPAQGYTIERRAEDVRDFVARYPRVVLVAWSLGALEALRFLNRPGAARSARIEALVIVDSSVGEGHAQAPPPPGTGFIDELKRNRNATVESFVRAIFRQPLAEAELLALRDGALRMPLEASLSLFPSSVPRSYWRRAVHAFHRPLLYVVTPQFAAQAAALRRNRPGTQVEVFRDAGHALFVDEPERFNALLLRFLADNGVGMDGAAPVATRAARR